MGTVDDAIAESFQASAATYVDELIGTLCIHAGSMTDARNLAGSIAALTRHVR